MLEISADVAGALSVISVVVTACDVDALSIVWGFEV